MIRRILLDIDDVLNQFTLYALRHVGCVLSSLNEFPAHVGFVIEDAANELLGYKRYSDKASFFAEIDRDFWATVPVSQECGWLIQLCEQLVGRDNICLLTSPTHQPDCLAGKLEWIHDNLPAWLHRQYLIGPVKHFCAMPEALLIDDSLKNVEMFEAHGGQTILIPRPWNSYTAVAESMVREAMCDLPV